MSVEAAGYWCGEGEGSHCGYCGGDASSVSTGIFMSFISTELYNKLIDRGWRRSGAYMYKPNMKKTCCPQYTIKCDATNFRASRSQKRVIQACNNFLKTTAPGTLPQIKTYSTKKHDQAANDKLQTKVKFKNSADKDTGRPPKTAIALSESSKKRDFRRLRKLKKIAAERGVDWETLTVADFNFKDSFRSISDRLEDIKNCDRFSARLVRISSISDSDFQKTFDVSHRVYTNYQVAIHHDEPEDCTAKKYQKFLCSPPFDKDGDSGGYHYQYYIDGVLIAVGVLDILPNCVSSVYLFYNPDYRSLSLGTLAALFEIDLTLSFNKIYPCLKWYYMGFYLHQCRKMRYKAAFKPSFLLCPKNYTWWPIRACQDMLDNAKYQEFDAREEELNISDEFLGNLKILYNRKLCLYSVYKRIVSEDIYEGFIHTFVELVGKENAEDICIFV